MIGHGWLAADPDAPSILAGVSFEPAFPTRRQEYGFLHRTLEQLEPGTALDAGTGYNPHIHIAPYIAANMGWWVEAVDIDLRMFALPWHRLIKRTLANMGALPHPDAVFNLVFSISVMEHMSWENRNSFLNEASRLLVPGGLLVVTTDLQEPEELAAEVATKHFDVGERLPDPEAILDPRVSFLVARKQ